MFKSVFRRTGKMIKPFVNVSAWMDWKGLKEDNQRIGRLAKDLLVAKKVEARSETFEEAIVRLNLTEAKIEARQRYLKRLAMVYTLIAAGIAIYGLYLLFFLGTFLGFVVTLAVLYVALALAFQQHFWYIQMRERRLGLRFQDWLQIAFGIGKARQ